jgi:hypothetical protein
VLCSTPSSSGSRVSYERTGQRHGRVGAAGAARTQIELVAAAREGVRVAAVNPDPARALAVTRGALGGRGDDARIRVHRPHIVGRVAEVTVTLERHFALPLLGRFSVPLAARAAMRVER